MATADSTALIDEQLSKETCDLVMRVLLIGLDAYGEIERLTNDYEIVTMGKPLPEEYETLRPTHPTGAADTVSLFAQALRMINNLTPAANNS